jgi:hypothetical protein
MLGWVKVEMSLLIAMDKGAGRYHLGIEKGLAGQ